MFFTLGLTLILMHEMDAIRCKEWRIFPGLHLLNDRWGFIVFMWLHVPLFGWILFELMQTDNQGIIKGLNIFFIIHFGLHLLFLMHKKNEFKSFTSWAIIAGCALCGVLSLMLES